jgi:hypothetical protein
MSARIQMVDPNTARSMIETAKPDLTDHERNTLSQGLSFSSKIWVGTWAGELVCVWGLIPPTLLSDSAYLWLFCTEKLEEHKFLFIRWSQLEMGEMLRLYPRIIGVTDPQNERAVRWLRWLGAEFGELNGKLLPFRIRSR